MFADDVAATAITWLFVRTVKLKDKPVARIDRDASQAALGDAEIVKPSIIRVGEQKEFPVRIREQTVQ